MPPTDWMVLGFGIALAAYLAVAAIVAALGRRIDFRALAGFARASLALLRRLIADPRVARRHKLALAAAVGYLLLPFDLVPDFLPVAGYLDDALVVALALRLVLNHAGDAVVAELWDGSARGLELLLRMARVSLWPGPAAHAWSIGAGALGLAVCVWVDIADNCAGGRTCRESDPLLLSTGRGIAIALCLCGTLGLSARFVAVRRNADRSS